MIFSDKYKLTFCYSKDGNSFTVETPFIPIADIYVPADKYSPLHNGKHIKAQDLKNLLTYRKSSLALTMANLMHFDLSDFVLQAGIYTPNFGEFRLNSLQYAHDGKDVVLNPDSVDCDPIVPRDRIIVPYVQIRDYYALLYLIEI